MRVLGELSMTRFVIICEQDNDGVTHEYLKDRVEDLVLCEICYENFETAIVPVVRTNIGYVMNKELPTINIDY